MMAVLNVVLPVFLLVLLGYAMTRFQVLEAEHFNGISRYILRIGMPILIFRALVSQPLHETLDARYLLAYALASVGGFLLTMWLMKKRAQPPVLAVLHGLSGGMANSGFIGYPLLLLSIGEVAGRFFAMNVLVENILILPLALILIDWYGQHNSQISATLLRIIKNLSRNPMMQALFAGVLWQLLGLDLPIFLERTLNIASGATTTLALIIIGSSLFGMKMRGAWRSTALAASGSLLVMPLLAALFLSAFDVERDVFYAGVLLAFAPAPSIYVIFGRQHGFEQETAAVMLFTTLCSIVPISLVLWLWH